MNTVKIKFYAIDDWNRPVFKSEDAHFYGSVDILFDWSDTEKEVLEKVKVEDLVFFGFKFNCEPDGIKPSRPLEIVEVKSTTKTEEDND